MSVPRTLHARVWSNESDETTFDGERRSYACGKVAYTCGEVGVHVQPASSSSSISHRPMSHACRESAEPINSSFIPGVSKLLQPWKSAYLRTIAVILTRVFDTSKSARARAHWIRWVTCVFAPCYEAAPWCIVCNRLPITRHATILILSLFSVFSRSYFLSEINKSQSQISLRVIPRASRMP